MRTKTIAICALLTSLAGCEPRNEEEWKKLSWLEQQFTPICLAGCEDAETKKRINAEVAEQEARESVRNQRLDSVCRAAVQAWLNQWGTNAKVLDWKGFKPGVSTLGYIDQTSTGFRYSVRANVSGHSSELSIECFIGNNYELLDLKTKWLN